MKILLAQINTIVGNIDYNTTKILELVQKGKEKRAHLVVFPEMTLLGYPPKDLVLQTELIEKNLEALNRVKNASSGIGVLIGYVDKNPTRKGKGLFNAAALCADGKIISRHFKTLLPTYDIFDEARYFDPAPSVQTVSFKGKKIAVTICEDIWDFDPRGKKQNLYPMDPLEHLFREKPDLVINLSASPFTLGKRKARFQVLKNLARNFSRTVIHVNHVGGNDSVIFDGWSVAVDKNGHILAQTKDFVEDAVLFDMHNTKEQKRFPTKDSMERLLEALILGLRDYVKKCGFEKCVLGLSGGIDSALVAAIACRALKPENVIGVIMPSRFSSKESTQDALVLAENLGMACRTLPIEPPFTSFLNLLKPEFDKLPFDVTEENIQARIRGILLMALSNKFGWLVLSTGNKSELAMGYCTLYGDMTGGLAVISDVPKTLVYKLAQYINRKKEIIPRSVIEKPPSAELRPDQKDSDSLPPYEILDPIIRQYIEERKSANLIASELGHEIAFVQDIINTIAKNEYKRRQAAPGLKVTSRAFGEGWRMPIAASWGDINP